LELADNDLASGIGLLYRERYSLAVLFALN
jgi:hypothetical protein